MAGQYAAEAGAVSITSCGTALREVVASSITARAAYDDMPSGRPLAYPAVVVVWTSTKSDSLLHMGAGGAQKWARSAVRNTHQFSVYALLSTTQNTEAEGAAQKTAAQSILNAVNNDATLRGTSGVDRCAAAKVVTIQPYREVIDDTTVVAGVQATVAVEEM